jgi:serine phosphatase RsbU (regulator of sigma subunit)
MAGSHLDITERKAMEEQLRMQMAQLIAAEEIQSHLLPAAPPEMPAFEIAAKCYPAEFAAGDHFDFLELSTGVRIAVIGDVTGHGVGPAILMASLHAHLRSLAHVHSDLCAMITQANRILEGESPPNHFVTLLAVAMHQQTREIVYVRCGHPPGFIMNQEGVVTGWMEEGNLPLGIMPHHVFTCSEPVPLNQGDTVVMLTDGILEAFSPERQPFGTERTVEVVRENLEAPVERIIDALRCAVAEHTKCQELSDDLTLIILRVK